MQENLDEQLEMHEEERLRALHLAHLNQQERAGLLDDDEDEDDEDEDGDEQEGEHSYKKTKKAMEEAEESEAQASRAGIGEGAAGEGAAAEGGVAAEGAAGAAAAEGAAGAAAAEGAAAEGATAAAAATSEVWVPALGIGALIVLIIALVIFIIVSLVSLCNAKGAKGWLARRVSTAASFLGFTDSDICKQFGVKTDDNGLFAGGNSGGGGAGSTWGKISDAEARQYLLSAGITVNAPRPTTSLEGINMETINELIMFKASCDAWARASGRGACNVVVTGGTEGGHSAGACSHANGYKFDLRLDPTVSAYIQSTFYDTQTTRSDGARMWQNAAAVYALEGDHWDVVTACGAPAAP